MNVNIHFDHEIDEEKSLQLDELARRLAEDEKINIEKVYQELEPGKKVIDLTIAISIISFQ